MSSRIKNEQVKTAALCLAMAAPLLLLCSKSSPLYPLNDWMDANIFFTAGKAMLRGRVLYRDVFDHKGPLLYLLYGLGSLADRCGFGGVFVLEILAFAAFLYLSLCTVRLLVPDAHPLWLALPAAGIAASHAFAWGGSAEEFCLPLLAAAGYSTLALVCAPPQRRRPLPGLAVLAMGTAAGCVLWIKYTMLGFFLGSVLVLAAVYAHRGWRRELAISCGLYLGGMGLATLPWLCYFGWNGALADWWEVYFYDNLFLYAGRDGAAGSVPLTVLQKLWWGCHDSPLLALLLLAGLLTVLLDALRRHTPALAAAVLLPLAGLLPASTSGRYLVYYFLPYAVWAPLAAVPLARTAQKCRSAAVRRVAPAASAAAALAVSVFLSPAAPYRLQPKAALPQYRFAAEMEPGTVLLNYDALDGGFYTVTGTLPPCRYFCVTGMPLPDQLAEQSALLRAGGTDYVVSLAPDLAQTFPAYEQADSCTYDSGEGMRTWYLYRRRA